MDIGAKSDTKVDDRKINYLVLIHGRGFRAWCWYKNITLLEEMVMKLEKKEKEHKVGSGRMMVSSTNPHNKEIVIRRRIISIFNKRQDDFPSLREYNDYKEEAKGTSQNSQAGFGAVPQGQYAPTLPDSLDPQAWAHNGTTWRG
ncbi:CDK-activating kinase assembly factor MAT1 [Spatholobus suberectus]|nr:CDK-activating kinase assembly factor MAT1 [Spatholobus suberectus]